MVTGTLGMPARPSFAEECETRRIVTGGKIEGAPRGCLTARRVPFAASALGEPEWELLGDTRQFSSRRTLRDVKFAYEWPPTAGRQVKGIQDTENERVRKRMKGKGEESGVGQVMNDDFAKEFK
jgi:hypothetical protein